jgi:hypothetical protein
MSTEIRAQDKIDAPDTLTAPLSRRELRPMINKARRYGRAFKRNGQLWAVELRLLQDAGAHLSYGRKSFGAWAAIEFADLDLSADNANKLSQQGRVILALQRNERVDLEDSRTFPGPTGTRGLASILATHGEQAMLQVHDACAAGNVIGSTVAAAAAAVLPQPPATAAPESPPDWDDHEDEPEQVSPELSEYRKRVERLRNYLDELACADDADPVAITREYTHFVSDAQALKPALDAVLPAEGADQ